ncbi:uncharacterized protein PV09_07126 [Verruconis gallopava]|uniref:HCNGP-like protein n=1 Tax=Verruconis gallopava TaxID=253628 RepID=A0A0D2AQC7_9PEZI|nr:uncharacterized protein PV09_07126 [Verruconis gallopava]KIW01354.1 hypothetical protein PV09_07126 [Verruconis gallopava]
MLGLSGYASSDEEDEGQKISTNTQLNTDKVGTKKNENLSLASKTAISASSAVLMHSDVPIERPTQGPAMPPDEESEFVYEEPDRELSYDEARAAIRSMTMPPVPNFSIPPSPPGSPPSASTKKFAHFLKLKKQGVHFNERLEKTPALKNPTLFQKLKQHAGISDEEQYATTLPEDLAVPVTFPPWAYADELGKTQANIRQKKDQKPRDTIDFVPATQRSS